MAKFNPLWTQRRIRAWLLALANRFEESESTAQQTDRAAVTSRRGTADREPPFRDRPAEDTGRGDTSLNVLRTTQGAGRGAAPNALREGAAPRGQTAIHGTPPDAVAPQTAQENFTGGMPVRAGRSSADPRAERTLGIPSYLEPVAMPFPVKWLHALSNAAIWNNHVSYAVTNIVSLANAPHEVEFPDKVPDRVKQKAMEHLKSVRDTWHDFSAGHMSLQSDLFRQIATFGPLSAEAEIRPDLKGIAKIHLVSPEEIRFSYNRKEGRYQALQQVPLIRNTMPNEQNGHLVLNPATYNYVALDRSGQLPYAIPPLLSALEKLAIEAGMLDSFQYIMKMMGMLGFLEVLLEAPQRQGGESDQDYDERLSAYLNEQIPEIEAGFDKGIFVGFKKGAEVKLTGTNVKADNAEQFLKIIKGYIFSGLKQDPNLHGENYAVTETFGRVILAKMSQDMTRYQEILAAFWKRVYHTELILAGFPIPFLNVTFQRTVITDQKRERETEKLHSETVTHNRDQGYISQDDAARELGYEKAHAPGPVRETKKPGGQGEDSDDANTPDNTTPEGTENTLPAARSSESLSFGDAEDDFIDAYYQQVDALYQQGLQEVRPRLEDAVQQLAPEASVDDTAEAILSSLQVWWGEAFSTRLPEICDEHVTQVYNHFRADTSVMDNLEFSADRTAARRGGPPPPAGMLLEGPPQVRQGLSDYRAIEHLSQADAYYMGKFIREQETIARIRGWIIARLETGVSITRSDRGAGDSEAFRMFFNALDEQLLRERFQLRRVVETTVNKARNYGNVQYLHQAEVAEFEIVSVMDRKTCPYCRTLNGRTFSVEKAVDRIATLADSAPEQVPRISPFATVFTVSELEKMSSEALEKAGISMPPFHPHCRDRVVAVA